MNTIKDKYAGCFFFLDVEGQSMMAIDKESLLIRSVAGEERRVGTAMDAKQQHYWIQQEDGQSVYGRILRKSLGIKTTDTLGNEVEILLDNLPKPLDLEIDDSIQRIYWTDKGGADQGSRFNCADITEEGLFCHHVIRIDFKGMIGLTLDRTSGLAWVADVAGNLFKVDLIDGRISMDAIFFEL